MGGALPHAFPHRQGRGAAAFRHPARDRRTARLHQPSRPVGGRALHEALFPRRQGCRRPDPHLLRRARGRAGQACAGLQPHLPHLLAPQAQARRHLRFHRRQPPHQHRRRPGVRARPGQSAETVLVRRQARAGIPSRCAEAVDPLARPGQQVAAARRGGQPAVPRHPDLRPQRRAQSAAHERGRRCSAS